MAVITGEIATQSFELVRDRIAEILADELPEQFVLSTASSDLKSVLQAEVYTERVVPFDKTDLPCINVMLSSGDYNNQDVQKVDGAYTFFIDCYTSAKNKADERADKLANIKLQKLMGVCRAILMDAQYKTLGFAAPFIMNRKVTALAIGNISQQDSANVMMGRLNVSVRVIESVNLKEVDLIAGFETTVKLYETEKGFLWEKQDY